MVSLLLALNIAASAAALPNAKFHYVYNHLSADEQKILDDNGVDNDEKLEAFADEKNASKPNGSSGSHSKAIEHVSNHLSEHYPDYLWRKTAGNSTRAVSRGIPVNVNGNAFPKAEILTAIENTGVASDYGGCGPIAIMGVMDYFSRYLGYSEYIENPLSSSDRISLAEDVLSKSKTFELGFKEKNTMMYPWDFESAFDGLTRDYGLGGIVDSRHTWKLFKGHQEERWDAIVDSVDNGLPVTLMTGLWSGDGEFSKHYTNIFGYETWTGLKSSTGERVKKDFIVARLNWQSRELEYYCDASILNDGMVALITYDINYANSYAIRASDFAEEFVNSNGGGQYFFYDKEASVATESGKTLQTNRKRCSYIENQYLVLSPNRENAGEAYLDIALPHSVAKMTFSSALWGSSEGIADETFKLQYYSSGWHDHVSFDLSQFSKLRQYPKTYTVLLPKETTRFRFLANHSNPTGDRNKGRIVLDNIHFQYHS